MKIKKEYSIALMVLVGMGLLIFGINFLKGLDIFKKRNEFYVLYNDVTGVNESTAVLYNGFKVGQVIDRHLMEDGSGRIVVSFQLDEQGLRVPSDTRVQIYSPDLFSRSLQLIMGESTDLAQAGDTLIGDVQLSLADAVSTQIDPLKQRAESMIANVDTLLTRLQLILNDEARDDIDAGFNSIRRTLDALHRSAERVDELIVKESEAISATVENIKTVTDNLVAYNERIVRILANMDTLSTSLAQADLDSLMMNIRTSSEHLRNITSGLERGDGTLGALLHNDTLYRNLESASRELDMLLEDLRLNPNRYMHLSVFGKKDRQPKLSKSDVERIKDAIEDDVRP